MSSISSIATSGFAAAAPLPQASAAIQSQSPQVYAPQQVSAPQQLSQAANAGGGNAQPSRQAAPAPTPNSSAQIATPNFGLAIEMMQQQIAQIEFMSNAEVARVYSQMMQTLMGG